MVLRQKIFLAFVVVLNSLLWLIPSDVVELVARDKHTLLGRYSREHFAWILAVGIFTIIGLYVDQAPAGKYRRRWFQIVAILLCLIPAIAVLDTLSRSDERSHYVRSGLLYSRPAGFTYEGIHVDRSRAHKTFPNASEHYPDVHCRYQADSDGYRNRVVSEPVDIVALGDSFAEGSHVSDEHVWVSQMADATGWRIRNLGMSGYGPGHYLESLKRIGLPHSPKIVVCLLYEGNDFRRAAINRGVAGESFTRRLQQYVKKSPIVEGLDQLLIETLGPVGADWSFEGAEVLSWLPLGVPEGHDAKYYAFAPKQILQNNDTASTFSQNEEWRGVEKILESTRRLCEERGARFVVGLAPTKAHVVLPIARNRLEPELVWGFAALRSHRLPTPDHFMRRLFENLEAKQQVVSSWCGEHGVSFVELTDTLQRAAISGKQVYYTYDQHWTPDGHAVVADAMATAVLPLLTPESDSPVEIAERATDQIEGEDDSN